MLHFYFSIHWVFRGFEYWNMWNGINLRQIWHCRHLRDEWTGWHLPQTYFVWQDTLWGSNMWLYVNSVQMVFGVCLEEERLTLADCWSEQFKIQGINLVKILQGSQGPSDAPEDWWQRLQREHSIRERERGGGGRRGRQLQRYSHYSDLPKKQHMGNLSFHNMKGFILQNKITYRTETKEGNDGSGHNGEPTSWCNKLIQ